MYIADTSDLTLDIWSLMRSSAELLGKGLLWVSAITSVRVPGARVQQNWNASMGVSNGEYLLGLGIGDITGPVVETNMMGYADRQQTDTGLHMRQRSRAWIVADPSAPSNRVVFINADIGMGDTGIRRSIIHRLSHEYPDLYTHTNIALVATHSHAGVGGYLENLLPHITSLGYVPQTAEAIVEGTVLAVQRAHASLTPGRLRLGNATVVGANINRSPSAARYEADVDKEMTVLRFEDGEGSARGFLSFFPVHGTSLYQNNTLISGDNKGMAAYLYEAMVEPDAMPGQTNFIAGFTQCTLGAVCQSPGKPWDGKPCDFEHSTCGNTTQDCRGRGPGFRISDFESNRIIAQLQVDGAKSVMDRPEDMMPVAGPVKAVHTYADMSFRSFELPDGRTVQTCPSALGYSFAGGTTDGPGAFDFTQGDNSTSQNPFWEFVKVAVTPRPPPEQVLCHYPKPILLDTGYAEKPYAWSPSTVDIQILRVGNLVMLIIPGEMTTMAGRRIREAIRANLIASGVIGEDAYVVVAGPANTYAHYVTTQEEYSVQRYEGASTIFGPHTLDAYIHEYGKLVRYLAPGITEMPPSDAAPIDLTSEVISLQLPVIQDTAPLGKNFGDVLADVEVDAPYHAGDTVAARFVGYNNLRLEQTFLTVDRWLDEQWVPVRSDSHPSTTYRWERTNVAFGVSTVNVTWTVEPDTPAGTYRFTYYGDAKHILGTITPFIGRSSNFTVA
ncbi:Neutral/alkaline nonlysosomal ceramidase [Fomitopsis serialis]|uniref:Neutral/alkaline nonlysosomal ceramidase n=1 Tax=Fomitopsis serialis TaxID=139415 RepID=UPI002008E9FD|nr:Neutral/alkaline nonlysosomal ceramidase [Neoantrodia serialis]KAH9915508.1 Neutral/alkaline nonlysosomal ceramidase [Neoantrodia serialis]